MSDITERVKKIFVENLNVEESKVNENSRISEDLKADSLSSAEVVIALEEEFQIDIPEEKASEIKTFGDAVQCIQDALAEKKA